MENRTMLKGIIGVTVVIALVIFIISLKPADDSGDDWYQYAKKVVSICDDFLDFKIDGNEAGNRIEMIVNALPEPKKHFEKIIQIKIDSTQIPFYGYKVDFAKVLKYRNDLAETINMGKKVV